jgi:hypothetical protein
MISRKAATVALAVTLLIGSTFIFAGCPRKGPGQRAGEKIDRAVNDLTR